MKRTQSEIARSASFQIDVIAYYINYLSGVKNALDCFSIYLFHITKLAKKNKTASRLPYFSLVAC